MRHSWELIHWCSQDQAWWWFQGSIHHRTNNSQDHISGILQDQISRGKSLRSLLRKKLIQGHISCCHRGCNRTGTQHRHWCSGIGHSSGGNNEILCIRLSQTLCWFQADVRVHTLCTHHDWSKTHSCQLNRVVFPWLLGSTKTQKAPRRWSRISS